MLKLLLDAEQEDQLKHICMYVAVFHAICTPVAALVAANRGLNWAPLTAKVISTFMLLFAIGC